MTTRNVGAAPAPRPNLDPRPTRNDVILMVGFNEGAAHEAQSLRARGNAVTLIRDSVVGDDRVRLFAGTPRAVTHDLSTPGGVEGFVGALRLPREQSQRVADALLSAGPDARDELGTLAAIWADGERGGPVPSRLVLSGHSGGTSIWGDGNGSVDYSTVFKLAEAMPRAAAQIEDVKLAACYAGTADNAETFQAAFPNMRTFFGYTDSAPGAHSGATAHLSRWDRQTRGRAESLDRAPFLPTRKGDSVAFWTSEQGYVDGRPREAVSTLRGRVDAQRPTYQSFHAGLETQASPSSGPLRDYYNALQRLAQHPETPPAEKATLRTEIDATIRLLYCGQDRRAGVSTESRRRAAGGLRRARDVRARLRHDEPQGRARRDQPGRRRGRGAGRRGARRCAVDAAAPPRPPRSRSARHPRRLDLSLTALPVPHPGGSSRRVMLRSGAWGSAR